ncbi:mannitol dehydrogenase family protein [Aestuariibius sp. 2305UL40-4]|uniref:mannitol dehydrogenase family protein n=1 Tax=Aestuariibius violaceus TaxID=3234132 RepID=UPI00345E1464
MASVADSVRLGLGTLEQLPEGIERPAYARSDLTPGIVHIGLGNFHRAHQAWYLHRLMQRGAALDWAIIGAGVRAYDAAMRERLLAQDCLTTLIELDPGGTSAEVIGPMVDYLPIEEGNGTLIRQMADPAIRIVSLTVTEGGYYLDPTSGAFDEGHEDVRYDAAHPDAPRTVFGAIVAALKARREAGVGPFTGLSCDNLQGNGDILRDCVVGLSRLSDPDLAAWIAAEGAFPNSMVDCIVPATTPEVLAQAAALGVADQAPVTHENFRQWVIEDRFCAGRPAFEEVGAIVTDDVPIYEAMKLRILNGGHQLLANVGEVLGVPTIADCMADAGIAGFFRKVQEREIVPYVRPVPESSPEDYLALVTRRFANPAIRDTTRRVAFDGSARHPGFLFPSLRDAMARGGSVRGLALAQAFWARMCAGVREDGSAIEPNDPVWAALHGAALAARADPAAWIGQGDLYGDLARHDGFAATFAEWLTLIWRDGSRAALEAYLAEA